MPTHTDEPARVRARRLRSAIVLGLACASLASLAALALASGDREPSSAISPQALDRLLYGQVAGQRSAVRVASTKAAGAASLAVSSHAARTRS